MILRAYGERLTVDDASLITTGAPGVDGRSAGGGQGVVLGDVAHPQTALEQRLCIGRLRVVEACVLDGALDRRFDTVCSPRGRCVAARASRRHRGIAECPIELGDGRHVNVTVRRV